MLAMLQAETAEEKEDPYLVYGKTQSYFTRKMTGYLWYKRLPYQLRVSSTRSLEGWPGGIPALRCPGGTVMWDSTVGTATRIIVCVAKIYCHRT